MNTEIMVKEFIDEWKSELLEDIEHFQNLDNKRDDSGYNETYPYGHGIVKGRIKELTCTLQKLTELEELL